MRRGGVTVDVTPRFLAAIARVSSRAARRASRALIEERDVGSNEGRAS